MDTSQLGIIGATIIKITICLSMLKVQLATCASGLNTTVVKANYTKLINYLATVNYLY